MCYSLQLQRCILLCLGACVVANEFVCLSVHLSGCFFRLCLCIYVFMLRERLPSSALGIIKARESKQRKSSGRWIKNRSAWQTLIDRSGQSSLYLPGLERGRGGLRGPIMLYSSISSAAPDTKIGHIFQFMAYLIIIVPLSRSTALEISPLSSNW